MEIDLGTLLWNFLKGLTRFWWLVILLAFIGSAVLYVKNSRFYTPMYRFGGVLYGHDRRK